MKNKPVRRIVMLTYPGANSIDTVGPLEVFATADSLSRLREGARLYQITIVAPSAGAVRMHSGLSLVADQAYRNLRGQVDTLFIAGGDARAAQKNAVLVSWVARMRPRVRRLCSVCTGAAILASAGLL